MSYSKLFVATTFLAGLSYSSPVAFAKGTPTATPTNSAPTQSSNDNNRGYTGKGSNPSESSSSEGYGFGKGSNGKHEGDDGLVGNDGRGPSYYGPDNHYQNDIYYNDNSAYTYSSSSVERENKDRGPAEVGLRYAVGQGLDASPELAGVGFYSRIFDTNQRYALEVSLDSLGSDIESGVNMRQGDVLVSYALFANPDGKLSPYGLIGLGATWHGIAGSQNIYGALGLGAGLDVKIAKSISFNIDGRLIADSDANEDTTVSAVSPVAASRNQLNDPQEFVLTSAGLSFRF